MDTNQEQSPSHLFTIRIWWEDLGDGNKELRGRIQHLLSGASLAFRDWPAMEAFIEKHLDQPGDADLIGE